MRNFKTIDVFTSAHFRGNPVAVVLEADGLTDEDMQAIAAWTNLSETTFHLKPTSPDADYRLRIFTPRSELPFAGHPTIGSAHGLIEAGLVRPRDGRVVQECGAGLVPITVGELDGRQTLQFELPPATIRDLTADETSRLVAILGSPLAAGAPPAFVDVGACWIVAELHDSGSVLALTPDLGASAKLESELGATGVTVFGRHFSGEADIEVRSFAPSCGVPEDPVCGSGNGSVAAYRLRSGRVSATHSYVATQGRCVGRDGRIFVMIKDGRVCVGGSAVTTVKGSIHV